MLRRKRNPKGCKKTKKDCKKSHNCLAIEPQLRFTLGLIEHYVRLFWTASKALLKRHLCLIMQVLLKKTGFSCTFQKIIVYLRHILKY